MSVEVTSAQQKWMPYAKQYVVHYTIDGERLTGQLAIQPVDIVASFAYAFEWYLAHQFEMREKLLVSTRLEFQKNLAERFGRPIDALWDEMLQATIDHFNPKVDVVVTETLPDSDTSTVPNEVNP